MTTDQIVERLKEFSNEEKAKSLTRFGVSAENALGINLPTLRKLAKELGRDHELALRLWQEDIHECKLLATLLAEPKQFTISQADQWVADLYSWDVCDQLCINLLSKTDYAWELPGRWAPQQAEFVRRIGIVMIAVLAVHHKKAKEEMFLQFIPFLKEYATDPRNFVKKAVNWAIRQLGKRSAMLHPHMMDLCHELLEMDSKPAHWIARDAIRELEEMDERKFRVKR